MRDMTPSRQAQAGLTRARALRWVKSSYPARVREAGPAPASPHDEIERPAFLDRSEPKDLTEWLKSGADPEVDIYPTVKRLVEGNPNFTPPRSARGLSYFTEAIVEATNKRLAGPNGSDPDFDPERSRWEGRVSGFFKRQFWIITWGPAPGEPGCQAPAEIVEKYGIATHA